MRLGAGEPAKAAKGRARMLGAAQRRGSGRRTREMNSVRRSGGCPRVVDARACLPMAVVLSLPNRKSSKMAYFYDGGARGRVFNGPLGPLARISHGLCYSIQLGCHPTAEAALRKTTVEDAGSHALQPTINAHRPRRARVGRGLPLDAVEQPCGAASSPSSRSQPVSSSSTSTM